METLVAIKSVNLGKLNKKLRDNLTSEISILKGLRHPHIVALIDCKETSAHMHLIMEFVALGDLSFFMKKRDTVKDNPMVGNMMTKYPNPRIGGLNEVVVRHFLLQLASALQFLRARNLIHRDVKPQNLLLSPSPDYFARERPDIMPYMASGDALEPLAGIRSLPMLKIADFGFARSLPSTSLAETLCGSPLYMAPEILRYEKYDAKADLWSVGTVLYEMMTSKPPFRASNHVELLRRIEKGEDRIKFPDDVLVSDSMQRLIRALLKRDPKERMSFADFFNHDTVISPIPGLAEEDLPRSDSRASTPRDVDRRRASRTEPARPSSRREMESPYTDSVRNASAEEVRTRTLQGPHKLLSTQSSRPGTGRKVTNEEPLSRIPTGEEPSSPTVARPGLPSHATAPGRQELHHKTVFPAAVSAQQQVQGYVSGQRTSSLQEVSDDREPDALRRRQEEADRVAQDIAFERDYVVVEKKQVEVNALADELEASPRINRNSSQTGASGAVVRRNTTQALTTTNSGTQTTASRAVHIASGRGRPDALHQRQSSYERRYGPSPTSATSAISKALNMASGRLFGIGISPPVNLVRGGRSPPMTYNAFPVHLEAQSSLVLVGEGGKSIALDEDTRYVQNVEEVAHRSDVVYGFAEVKYKQLTPNPPSQAGLGLQTGFIGSEDGLTVEAIVTVAEEALVLYVKALALLAKSMEVAANWWSQKNRDGPVIAGQMGQRMNNVVQWTRSRFNEVLEKTELVRQKLAEAQKRLPEDHPLHLNNISAATTGASSAMGSSAGQVIVTSGITAEKLMYDRALEMSRTAAINELTGEELPGCEISYITAIRMLEAVLECDDESTVTLNGSYLRSTDDDDAPINGMDEATRRTVKNRKYSSIDHSLMTLTVV